MLTPVTANSDPTGRWTGDRRNARRRRRVPAVLLCALVATLAMGQSAAGAQQAAAPSAQAAREALQEAAHLVQLGRLDEADARAQRALANPATRAAAHSLLGAIRFQQERLDESARLLEEAIRLDPRLLGALLTLAEVRIALGQTDAATALFRRAMDLDPMNQIARFGVARAAADNGNYREALEIASPVASAFELFPEGLFFLATAYLETGEQQAATALVPLWNRSTDIPQAWSIRLAAVYAAKGAPAAAIEILEQAKTVAPVSYELLVTLGGALLLNADPARALSSYDEALKLKPEALPALRQAAEVAERQGELDRSLSYWARLKKLLPDDPDVLRGFDRVSLKLK
jgi:tetratricopeptide (TPR) repeat protein